MARFRIGKVVEVTAEDAERIACTVATDDGATVAAIGYPNMLGPLEAGDRVVVNTTGTELGLGTGGLAFVLWNLDRPFENASGAGHIVKLRYTPWQTEVLSAEEDGSEHHRALRDAESIDGLPVVACGLHSQIAGVAAGVKAARPEARVGYAMSDGAAIPLALSDLVRTLKESGLIDVTATYGHAMGGDLEAVNVFSALLALRHAGHADVAIVSMGPGVVGTGTALGFTAIEQGHVLDAATALGGRPIAALRISFADARPRHRGVSHHTLTTLRLGARDRASVVVPVLLEEQASEIERQLTSAGILERHDVVRVAGEPGVAELARRGVAPTSMGRSIDETPELWLAAAAAGAFAASHLQEPVGDEP